MKIYVACLASYNNGVLHGQWIDATEDPREMGDAINEMLAKSRFPNVTRAKYHCDDCGVTVWQTESAYGPDGQPAPGLPETVECPDCGDQIPMVGKPFSSAEEWAIHDHEGLGDIGEYTSLDEIAKRVKLAECAEDSDIPLAVLLEAIDGYNVEPDECEDWIFDNYRGKADTIRDFAQEFTEETQDMSAIPDWLQYHIDWDSVARDFEIGGDFNFIRHDGEVYVFWNH